MGLLLKPAPAPLFPQAASCVLYYNTAPVIATASRDFNLMGAMRPQTPQDIFTTTILEYNAITVQGGNPMTVNGDIYHGGYLLHINSGADSRF